MDWGYRFFMFPISRDNATDNRMVIDAIDWYQTLNKKILQIMTVSGDGYFRNWCIGCRTWKIFDRIRRAWSYLGKACNEFIQGNIEESGMVFNFGLKN
jgi:hypothetical protein